MAKPWLGKVGALFHYMHSLPMDMKRGCIGILIHPHACLQLKDTHPQAGDRVHSADVFVPAVFLGKPRRGVANKKRPRRWRENFCSLRSLRPLGEVLVNLLKLFCGFDNQRFSVRTVFSKLICRASGCGGGSVHFVCFSFQVRC